MGLVANRTDYITSAIVCLANANKRKKPRKIWTALASFPSAARKQHWYPKQIRADRTVQGQLANLSLNKCVRFPSLLCMKQFSRVFCCQTVYVWKYSWVWWVLNANIHSFQSSHFTMCLPLPIFWFLKLPHQLSQNKAVGAGQQILPAEGIERADIYGQGLSCLLYIIAREPLSITFGEIRINKRSHCEQKGKKGGTFAWQLLCR